MNTNRLVFGIAVLAILAIVIFSSLEVRRDVICARFWEDKPSAPMFSRREKPSLWPVWDGFGGFALEWGQHQYDEGWVDLGKGQTLKVNLVIPDSEPGADFLWIASYLGRDWLEWRELAEDEALGLHGFTAEELEETKGRGWQYPMPVWSWVVVLDLPGSNDPVLLGPFFRLGCGEYGDNAVAFPGFEPKIRGEEEAPPSTR